MESKLFISLFVGGIAYIIIVLSGLLVHLPLHRILIRGIMVFICTGAGSGIILYLMEQMAKFKKEEKPLEDKTDEISNERTQEEGNGDQKQEFSPLNPPVLEVKNDD